MRGLWLYLFVQYTHKRLLSNVFIKENVSFDAGSCSIVASKLLSTYGHSFDSQLLFDNQSFMISIRKAQHETQFIKK